MDVQRWFAGADALEGKLKGQGRLARTGLSDNQCRRSVPQSTLEHGVETGDAGGGALETWLVRLGDPRGDEARVQLDPVAGDTEGVLALPIRAAAQLEDAEEPLIAR